MLDRIPGLSEHFFYACDDMFFGQPCLPGDFIKNGKLQLFLQTSSRPVKSEYSTVDHNNAWVNNKRLLEQRLGVTHCEKPQHVLTILSRSMMEKARGYFRAEWEATAHTKFRVQSNIHPVGLTQYVAVYEGAAEWVRVPKTHHLYIATNDHLGLWHLYLFALRFLRPKLFCVNDDTIEPNPKVVQVLEKNLRHLFPKKSSFEE
jgi:hypothetical protein